MDYVDPTYTGLNRLSLTTLPDDDHGSSHPEQITFESRGVPPLRLGGRAPRVTSQVMFTDVHGIGYSRFDDKGSVLMANIDAVLNLTEHVGGYLAQGTSADDNLQFYSLLLEDHTLEMHSYVQWRRPFSISRVIMARVLAKQHLKTAQLDTMLKTDIPAIISLRPCDGYRIVGLIAHGGGDSLTGSSSVTLKDLVIVVLVSLTVLHKTLGKSFFVFPFSVKQRVSGTMTEESVLDLALLLTILYKKVWCFRPYMCHDLVCFGFAEPREDPETGSLNEQRLLALWEAMRLLPPLVKSGTVVDPEIAKLAELDVETAGAPSDETGANATVKLEGARNFSRLFDGADVAESHPKLAERVRKILTTEENARMTRDRVEVLSRWQLPDTIETSRYPF